MTREVVLRLDKVSFGYGRERRLFSELSLEVRAGDRLALVGANGVGKSTLLLLLNGTHRPLSGSLQVEGKTFDYSAKALRGLRSTVGIVLQDPDDQLFAPTVEQDVAFGLLNQGVSVETVRQDVARILERMAIGHLAGRSIHELSVGEKKRVALAGVLVLQPQVLLLDEPTAGLDDEGACALLRLLRELQVEGTACVIATHDTDFALEWAENVAILSAGALCERGPSAELLSQHDRLQVAKLRAPLVLALYESLRRTFPELPEKPIPRSREELRGWLESGLRKAEGSA